MKAYYKPFAAAMLAAFAAVAAVPLRWTVETSRAQPASFDSYHGETLELCADLLSYGKPLALAGVAQLFYQTNNMTGWWTAPATISSNRIEATFSPSMDPGASQLYCFLGVTGSIYRAAFRLRLLNAPGAEPGNLPLPPLAIDFARVSTENAPWIPKEGGTVEQIRVTDRIFFGNPPPAEGQGLPNKFLALGDGSLVTKSPEGRTVRIVDEYNFYDVFWEMFGEDLGSLAGMVTEHDGSISELASVASNALPRTEAAQTYATKTEMSEKVARNGISRVTGSFGLQNPDNSMLLSADNSHFYGSAESLMLNYGVGIIFDVDSWRWASAAEEDEEIVLDPFAYTSELSSLSGRVDAIPMTYAQLSEIASVNCSVQTVVDPANNTLPTFQVPAAVPGGVRDWIVHVVSSGDTDITVTGFPATVDNGKTANFFSTTAAADITKPCTHGTVTTFTFSEINSTASAVNFFVMRAELQRVSPSN